MMLFALQARAPCIFGNKSPLETSRMFASGKQAQVEKKKGFDVK
jgi:hypothetical protein